MTRTTTVSMTDRADQIEADELPPVEAQIEDIRETANEEYENVWEIPDAMENRYEDLQADAKDLRGEANVLREYADEWGSGEWTIRTLSAGGVAAVQDEVIEASGVDMSGGGTPKAGYAQLQVVKVGVVEGPDGAPDVDDIPDAVQDWLYECIDEFNSTAEVELGNSSLRADLMNSES